MKPGDVLLLENVRYEAGEEKNDEELGKRLTALCDVYVNDAFATAHRGHSSNVAIVKFVKERAAGLLMKNEIAYFEKALVSPPVRSRRSSAGRRSPGRSRRSTTSSTRWTRS